MNIRAKTVTLLEEYIGINLHDLALSNGFLDIISKTKATKEKINELCFIKIGKKCVSEDTTKLAEVLQRGLCFPGDSADLPDQLLAL